MFAAGLKTLPDDEAAIEVNREAFRAATAVAELMGTQGGVFVTVQDTGGDFGLSGSERCWLGGVAALAKTAAREWPKAQVRAIDIDQFYAVV